MTNMEKHGAKRIYPRGEGDASDDFDGQFQAWYRSLWETLAQELSIDFGESMAAKQEPMYEVEVIKGTQPLNPFVASFGSSRYAGR